MLEKFIWNAIASPNFVDFHFAYDDAQILIMEEIVMIWQEMVLMEKIGPKLY